MSMAARGSAIHLVHLERLESTKWAMDRHVCACFVFLFFSLSLLLFPVRITADLLHLQPSNLSRNSHCFAGGQTKRGKADGLGSMGESRVLSPTESADRCVARLTLETITKIHTLDCQIWLTRVAHRDLSHVGCLLSS